MTDYPSYEAFVRNLYLGRELQDRLGIPFEFANITDIPGNSWSVPSVLASAGIRYFSDAANQDRGPLMEYGRWNVRSPFWWEGPDGQRVLTWFSSHYHQMKAVCGLPPAMESGRGGLTRFLRAYEMVNYAPDAVLLFGTEVENLPMEYDDAAFVERWNAAYAWPQMISCRFAEFFQYIEKNFAANIPVVRGEAGAYWGDNAGIFAWGTARDRGNQARVIGAESLATLTAAMNPALRFPQELDRAIWHNILLFIEHTYGSHRTRGQPEHDEVVGQLTDKDDQTVSAEWDIDRLMRTGMSQLADMVKTEGENLIVFNPLSWKRSGLVRFMVARGTTLTDVATGKLVDYEVVADKDGAQTIRFWAVDMPPVGYKVYRMGRGATRFAGPDESAKGQVVENRFYKITLDPSRAAIQSVYDKELNRELTDPSSPYRLNEYVMVTGGGTETGRGAGKENTRLLIQWFWLPPAELTEHHAEKGTLAGIEKTSWGWKIRMTASALHTPRIETEILLPDDAKRIELRNRIEVELPYAKHAAYFAFPWVLSAPTFRYDIANGFVNPATDLLEGACMDWFSMQQVVNAQDTALSVDLAIVDSPLVCLGDINRGRWPRKFTAASSTVFSYILNNYWSPKYGGIKSVELLNRYAITSAAKFEPAAAARFSREARLPAGDRRAQGQRQAARTSGRPAAGAGRDGDAVSRYPDHHRIEGGRGWQGPDRADPGNRRAGIRRHTVAALVGRCLGAGSQRRRSARKTIGQRRIRRAFSHSPQSGADHLIEDAALERIRPVIVADDMMIR